VGVEAGTEIEELKAALAARDADLAARQADLAAREADLAVRDARIAILEAELATLRELVGQNSSNSNKPPSSDPPGTGAKAPRKKKAKGRRRGGQRGHQGSHRALLPPEQMDAFEDHFPCACESCHAALPQVPDPGARRYQHTDLGRDGVFRTEHRRHRVKCRECGHKTWAKYEDAIPRYPFGPGLMSAVVLLTGVYHLSRRKTACLLWELLGVRISVGAVSRIEKRMSEAVAPAVDEAWEHARDAGVKHADGTSWLRAGVMLSLWVVATAAVTVFKVLADGQGNTLRSKLFVKVCGILVSDRATALKFWVMHRRQICWAHLLRKFIGFSERDGPVASLGKELLDFTGVVFQYWSDFREGKFGRPQLRAFMAPVRLQFEELLERAVAKGEKGFSGSCADILEHREALWTFIDREGVEPTNNHAERELRGFVLWRKRSFGAQSERGDQFAERLMSVAHTARKQRRDVLAFLTDCADAWLRKAEAPSLLAAG
jgi:transposase